MTKKELIERKKEIDASKFKAGLYVEPREEKLIKSQRLNHLIN